MGLHNIVKIINVDIVDIQLICVFLIFGLFLTIDL